jgi:hypothetical protein
MVAYIRSLIYGNKSIYNGALLVYLQKSSFQPNNFPIRHARKTVTKYFHTYIPRCIYFGITATQQIYPQLSTPIDT